MVYNLYAGVVDCRLGWRRNPNVLAFNSYMLGFVPHPNLRV